MELVELTPLKGALVGLPGVDGLSTEQRKRLTIAVELVANPSIVFMDEPTSGLDARAAAIVMRTVRNIVNTGRTIVCTIHQPSIDIFESFDEVLLSVSQISSLNPLLSIFWTHIFFFCCITIICRYLCFFKHNHSKEALLLRIESPSNDFGYLIQLSIYSSLKLLKHVTV